MPDPIQLVVTLAVALAGGGLAQYVTLWLRGRELTSAEAKALRSEYREDATTLRARMDALEVELERERREKLEVLAALARLQIRFGRLLGELNRMRREAGMPPLDPPFDDDGRD